MKKAEFIERYGEAAWVKHLRNQAYYKAHQEEAKEVAKNYREEHPEVQKAATAAWRKAHPDKMKAADKKWRDAHPEVKKASDKKYREAHPEQMKANNHETCRKGGKYYDKHLKDHRTGLQGARNRIRNKHGKQYRPFKMIIVPDSQIHHEWIPNTAEYNGLALVEKDPHQYGIIDVIVILDGKITVLTEKEVREGKK